MTEVAGSPAGRRARRGTWQPGRAVTRVSVRGAATGWRGPYVRRSPYWLGRLVSQLLNSGSASGSEFAAARYLVSFDACDISKYPFRIFEELPSIEGRQLATADSFTYAEQLGRIDHEASACGECRDIIRVRG
jgi:hypothetical protein